MRTGDIFLPPDVQPSVTLPQFNGGGEWGGASFDPETRTLYVNSSSEAEWIQMVPTRLEGNVTLSALGARIYGRVCSACHGTNQPAVPGAPAFASLQTVKERQTKAQVAALLESGRGQMPSFAGFSPVEKRAVVAFLFGEGGDERVGEADLKPTWAGGIPWVDT
jgi:quinoprotein glucose dehydrogenase